MLKQISLAVKSSATGKRILKNAAFLALGSIIGKAAIFGAFILAARYFGPETYGTYTTAFTHVFLMGILSKLGFDMIVIREGAKKQESATDIQNYIFPLRFWLSIIVWFLTILSAYFFNYSEATIKTILIMSPVIITGGAINSGILDHYSCFYMIIEKMQYATYVLVFRTILFGVIVTLLVIANKLTIDNLAFVVLFSSIAALFFQIQQASKFYHQKYSLRIDSKYLKPLIKPILLFGIVSILFEVSLRVNILMLDNLSSSREVGIYSAAWNLVSVGTLFIVSFSSSIFPNSARNIFNSNYRKKLFFGLSFLSFLFSIGCIIIFYIADFVITIIYGSSYKNASAILIIIIWFLPLRILSLWGHQILESANYLYLRIFVFIVPTITNILLNLLLIPKHYAAGAAYSAVISNIVLLVLSFIAAIIVVKRDSRFNENGKK